MTTTTTRPHTPALSHTYLSAQQVADMLPGISKGLLAMWRHEGKGPRYRKLGRAVVYALDEVEEWLEASIRQTDNGSE